MERPIIVYADKGVDGLSLAQTYSCLSAEVDECIHPIITMDAASLQSLPWHKNAALLLVPGGRDCFYQNALKGKGTDKIVRYVKDGGAYLGICAGAYFACEEIEFEKGHHKFEVCQKRSLAFYPGIAKGPAYGNHRFCYDSYQGVEAANISWENKMFHSYFNGGCLFTLPERYPDVKVLSRYLDLPDHPAAIVHCKVGKGAAVLSGVHLEYTPSLLPSDDCDLEKIKQDLMRSEGMRRKILRKILSKLGVKIRK